MPKCEIIYKIMSNSNLPMTTFPEENDCLFPAAINCQWLLS